MEREVRDVLSALAGCVAMRCAAEENRREIADIEMLQRAEWEAEFSSCSHPVAILPPAGISRHRARERKKSTAVKTNGCSNNDRGDRDLIFDAKSTGGGKQTSSSSGSDHTLADFDSPANQQQHCQQHRLLNSDQVLQYQTMTRAHSLGSATFLFNSCLEHKKQGEPDARRNPNGSDNLGGGGGGESQRSSAVGGRVSGHVGRRCSKNNGGISKSNRWGSAKATLKSSLSPYKLAPDTQQQSDDEYESGEMTSYSTCGNSFLTPDTPRSCPSVACNRLATDNSRKATGPVAREPLRRSTWLGPEISPLKNHPNGRFTNPNSIGFEAAAWPGPSKTRRWWDARKRGKYWREATNGSTTTTGKEIEYEHGVRPPARRGVFERNKAAGIALSGTGIDPQGHQTMGAQEWFGGGEGESACSLSAYQRQAREYSGLGSTVERCGEGGGTSPSDSSEKTTRGPSTFIWQNEICLAPVCLRSSTLCGVLSERGEASSKRRQSDGARESVWGDMPQSHATEKQGEGSRTYCLNQPEGLPSEGSRAAQNETCNGAVSPAGPLQETGDNVATGWSAEEYGQGGDEGEGVGAKLHEGVEYEPSTSEDDNGSCGNPGVISPRPERGDIGGDSSKNAEEGEVANHACAAMQAPTAKGVSRPPRPKSRRDSSDHRPRSGVNREAGGKVNNDAGALESARGELGPVLSSEVEVPFQFGTSDLVSGFLGARDPLYVRRRRWQQKPQHFQCYQYPQQEQQKRQRQQQRLLSQRRISSDDQEGRFERTDLQDKHMILLSRRLKQLVQLESLTIQWERLPRREREKLDRQQRLISSRFRVTEQARRDSSISLSVCASHGSTCTSTAVPFHGGGCVGGDSGGGGGGGGSSSNSSNSNHSTPTSGNGRVGGDSGASLSSGSGISPSSVDSDRPSAGGGRGVGTGVVGCVNGRPVGGSRDAVPAIVPAKGTTRHPRTASTSGVAPIGEGRRRREGGGVEERVGGSGGDSGGGAVTCRARDTDIAGGLARRGRGGDLSLSIVGMGSPVLSGGLAGASEMRSLMLSPSKGEGPCLRV